MTAARELQVGDRIAGYQLVAPIGAGGMGRVWVALDTVAPGLRLVAIKTALHDSNDHEFWAVLSDEAALASRIQHPNVCATYEFGDASGLHYLVMDWSDGASLRDLLDAQPDHRLEPVLAAHLVARVAAGLHSAHELTDDDGMSLGVVHRDVSPQNVLISLRGHVRLADFGVAKSRGQAHRPTETGEVKGKLSYMSPEQVASKPIDRRSDVFGLGAVLYEVALGVRPFHGADALATMYKILEQALTPPRTIDPEFPEELERILLKSLAKDADARYQSVDELRDDLQNFVAATRRVVTDKLTADLFDGALGARLRARNATIRQAAQRLRAGEPIAAELCPPQPPLAQAGGTPEGGIERTVSAHHSERAARSNRALLLALGGFGVLFLLLLAVTRRAPTGSTEPNVAPRVNPPETLVLAQASQLPPPPVASAASLSSATPASTGSVSIRSTASSGTRHQWPNHKISNKQLNGAPSQAKSNRRPVRAPRPIDSSNPFLTQ